MKVIVSLLLLSSFVFAQVPSRVTPKKLLTDVINGPYEKVELSTYYVKFPQRSDKLELTIEGESHWGCYRKYMYKTLENDKTIIVHRTPVYHPMDVCRNPKLIEETHDITIEKTTNWSHETYTILIPSDDELVVKQRNFKREISCKKADQRPARERYIINFKRRSDDASLQIVTRAMITNPMRGKRTSKPHGQEKVFSFQSDKTVNWSLIPSHICYAFVDQEYIFELEGDRGTMTTYKSTQIRPGTHWNCSVPKIPAPTPVEIDCSDSDDGRDYDDTRRDNEPPRRRPGDSRIPEKRIIENTETIEN